MVHPRHSSSLPLPSSVSTVPSISTQFDQDVSRRHCEVSDNQADSFSPSSSSTIASSGCQETPSRKRLTTPVTSSHCRSAKRRKPSPDDTPSTPRTRRRQSIGDYLSPTTISTGHSRRPARTLPPRFTNAPSTPSRERTFGTPTHSSPLDSFNQRQDLRLGIQPRVTQSIPFESPPKMTFLQPNYLSAKVEIEMLNGGEMELHGTPHTTTSNSLAGNVIVTMPALPVSAEGRFRVIRDVKILVEGKSEFFDDEGRYTPMRVYSTAYKLVSESEPVSIPSKDPRDPSGKVRLSIPFELRIPGWLPPTHLSLKTSTSYGLLSTVIVGWLDGDSSVPTKRLIFSNESLRASSKTTSHSAFTDFTVTRHRLELDPHGDTAVVAKKEFVLSENEMTVNCPFKCWITVPTWVDVNGSRGSLKVAIRLRCKTAQEMRRAGSAKVDAANEARSSDGDASASLGDDAADEPMPDTLPAGEDATGEAVDEAAESPDGDIVVDDAEDKAPMVYVKALGIDVEEIHTFSSTPLTSYTSVYPVPKVQPSSDLGRHGFISPPSMFARRNLADPLREQVPYKGSSLSPRLQSEDGVPRCFAFSGEGLAIKHGARCLHVVVPMPREGETQSQTSARPHSDVTGPFMELKHRLRIEIEYLAPGATEAESMTLAIPLKFGTSPATFPRDSSFGERLPPYIQMYTESGEQRPCAPLPLYEEQDPSDPMTETKIPALYHQERIVPLPTLSDFGSSSTPPPYTSSSSPFSPRSNLDSLDETSRSASPAGSSTSSLPSTMENEMVSPTPHSSPSMESLASSDDVAMLRGTKADKTRSRRHTIASTA